MLLPPACVLGEDKGASTLNNASSLDKGRFPEGKEWRKGPSSSPPFEILFSKNL